MQAHGGCLAEFEVLHTAAEGHRTAELADLVAVRSLADHQVRVLA